MTTEQKALALVNAVRDEAMQEGFGVRLVVDAEPVIFSEALCRAIEAHEADKKAFSDAVKRYVQFAEGAFHNGSVGYEAAQQLRSFILPEPEPDPLVEARRQIADRVLRQYGAPASDEDCIGLIVAALEEQAKIERIEQ